MIKLTKKFLSVFIFCLIGVIIFLFISTYRESYKSTLIINSTDAIFDGFNRPIGIAIDNQDVIYISNSGNNQIKKITADGALVKMWGSTGKKPGELNRPMHISFGLDENLYVAEFLNDRIQVFNKEGKHIRFLTINKESSNYLNAPGGVAVDKSGNVYIADFFNHLVRKLSPKGEFLYNIGAPGRIWPGKLHYPTDVAIGKDVLYVADAYNNRIQLFSLDGKFLHKWGGFFGMGIPGSLKTYFNIATGITVDDQGNLYIADFYNHRVKKLNSKGNVILIFGTDILHYPTDVAIDSKNNVWVVDFGNDRIVKFKKVKN